MKPHIRKSGGNWYVYRDHFRYSVGALFPLMYATTFKEICWHARQAFYE